MVEKMTDKKIEEKFLKAISNMSNEELIDWIDDGYTIKEKRKLIEK